ncbi:MAG: hypothetical protein ACR2FG_01305 [Marmoricola sp.]
MNATVLLPHDVAGANEWDDERFRLANRAVPGLTAQDPTADPDRVFYALPSVHAMLYAGWREAVEAVGEVTFADWLEEVLASAGGSWRYDVAVRTWATQVGAERVTLVLYPDDTRVIAALERALDVPAGTLVLPRAATPWVEPALAGALGRELEASFPQGQLSAELDRAGVLDLGWTAGAPFADPGELSRELVGRLEAVTAEMAEAVQRLGVKLVGDVDRLSWRPGVVDVGTAAGLAVGILEQVAVDSVSADASGDDATGHLAELQARREHLRLLQQSNRDPRMQPLETAAGRAILAVLGHRLARRSGRRR